MERKIFVLIRGQEVKCYMSLRHLTQNNSDIHYFKALRYLKKKNPYITPDFSIYADNVVYKRKKRKFKNKENY